MPQYTCRLIAVCLLALLLVTGCSTAPEMSVSAPSAAAKTRDQILQEHIVAFLHADQQGDMATAKAELIKAAEMGHAFSQTRLGLRLLSGRQFAMNHAEALYWLTKASDQDSARAQYGLGHVYSEGLGVPPNKELAFSYYSKAANHGYTDACYALALCYEYGTGTAPNPVEALRWYELAAERGSAGAQKNLGARYLEGRGVAQDYLRAYQWATLAMKNGDNYAISTQTSAAAHLSPQQVREAQDFAEQWRPVQQ